MFRINFAKKVYVYHVKYFDLVESMTSRIFTFVFILILGKVGLKKDKGVLKGRRKEETNEKIEAQLLYN